MKILYNDNNASTNMYNQYNTVATSGAQAGFNGLTGFKTWECYMLVKYGNAGSFGISDKYEYLIELPLYPDQVSEQISASWATQTVLGRSSPLSAYANTDLKSVSFSLDLHRDLLTGSFSHDEKTLAQAGGSPEKQYAGYQHQTDKGPFNTRSWYTSINKMLQISCYPQYTSNGLIPPTTYFIFGQMILKGYVRNYSTEWKKPILNSFYGWNSVTINMDCYPDSIISAYDMISNNKKGTASTQNTYNTTFPTTDTEKSNVMVRYSTTERSNSRTSNSLGGAIRDI